GQRPTKEV
ncbi:hypothetical protein BN1708_020543, partial [Verticillium longisporum]